MNKKERNTRQHFPVDVSRLRPYTREEIEYEKEHPGTDIFLNALANPRPRAPKKKALENELQSLVGGNLEKQGIPIQYQVPCDAGIADIVTPKAIYEIKLSLNPDMLFKAIGQVLVYREQINPLVKAFIVGYKGKHSSQQMKAIQETAKKLGVEIIFWEAAQ